MFSGRSGGMEDFTCNSTCWSESCCTQQQSAFEETLNPKPQTSNQNPKAKYPDGASSAHVNGQRCSRHFKVGLGVRGLGFGVGFWALGYHGCAA